jgi:biopolymer transport protein ExbB
MIHDIFTMYRNGEVIPYIMLAFVCVGYVIILEKFMAIQFLYKINFEKYNEQIKKMLLANDLDRARSYSRATSKTGVPMLVVRSIEAYEQDPLRVRATASVEGLRFFPRIRRRLTQLPNLAAAVIILGALGTIHGVWSSFQMVEGLEIGIKSFTLAASLSRALLPIAIALLAAILLMLPFGILDSMAWRLESEMELSMCLVLNILSPEMQSFFTQSSVSSAPSFREESEPAFSEQIPSVSSKTGAAAKGSSNDVHAKTAAPIPDEEEII